MEKKTKCYRCDEAPVVWYWYGCYEDYSQLAACGDHERSLEWARIYSFRIEKAKEGTIDLQENRQNMYVSKGIIDKIKDTMIASRAGSTNGTSSLQPKRAFTSSDDSREHLIASIIAVLPCPPVVLPSVFDNWTIGELKRFAPCESFEKKIDETARRRPR